MQVLLTVMADPPDPAAVQQLRAAGPAALDELFKLRKQFAALTKAPHNPAPIEKVERDIARLDEIIDQVGMQRHCAESRLYWYTDFDKAKAAARASGKPILSLRLLGKLNEDLSCANSRFFRTTLYANAEISEALRENYVLHWQSVRPVPKVTIEFGDGRTLVRTLTGNSIHYILTPDGEVVDALPGLYGPSAFLAKIGEGISDARRIAGLPADQRPRTIAHLHAVKLDAVEDAWRADLAAINQARLAAFVNKPTELKQPSPDVQKAAPPRADEAVRVALPKMAIQNRLVAAALPLSANPDRLADDGAWREIAARHAEDARLDDASRQLIRSENPTAGQAGRLASTKRLVEDPLLAMVRELESSIALDTVRNEYQLHRRIHQWLANEAYHPALDELNERVYAELFLTPSSDPWLGLAPANVYTALPHGGVVRSGR
jgi:hypothetical protein